MLKDVYPLYLNNKAVQLNADLEVTDKFTGEVALRVAQADSATILEGIAGTVRATEPMARMPAYERQAVLQHCGLTSWPMPCAWKRASRSRTRKGKWAA